MSILRKGSFFLGLASVLVWVGFRSRLQARLHDEPVVTRAVEIYLPSGGDWRVAVGADYAVFYIPVVGKGEMLGVIPVSKGHFVGLRIIPSMREDKDAVRIEISALLSSEKTLSDANCDDIRSWPNKEAGSYVAKKDESLLLSDLGRLGLPVLKMRVIGSSGLRPPGGGDRIFCGCESTRDELNDKLGFEGAPEPGKCMEIGKCARCCRYLKAERN